MDGSTVEEIELKITHSQKSRLMMTEIIKQWLLSLYESDDKASYQEYRELGPIVTRARRMSPIKKKKDE